MNNRPLKMKPGQWYSAEQYIPATPGLYQAKIKGLRKTGWAWFNGKGFCIFALNKDFALLYRGDKHYNPSPFEFRGLVKVGHEH